MKKEPLQQKEQEARRTRRDRGERHLTARDLWVLRWIADQYAVRLDQLIDAIKKLTENGIDTFGFGGNKTDEPSVIGWMPSAQIYFRDPDGHMLEFLTILPNPPNRSFNGPYSEWNGLSTSRNAHRHN